MNTENEKWNRLKTLNDSDISNENSENSTPSNHSLKLWNLNYGGFQFLMGVVLFFAGIYGIVSITELLIDVIKSIYHLPVLFFLIVPVLVAFWGLYLFCNAVFWGELGDSIHVVTPVGRRKIVWSDVRSVGFDLEYSSVLTPIPFISIPFSNHDIFFLKTRFREYRFKFKRNQRDAIRAIVGRHSR